MTFQISFKGFTPEHARTNTETMLKHLARPGALQPLVLMMDELAIEAAARYDAPSNQLAG